MKLSTKAILINSLSLALCLAFKLSLHLMPVKEIKLLGPGDLIGLFIVMLSNSGLFINAYSKKNSGKPLRQHRVFFLISVVLCAEVLLAFISYFFLGFAFHNFVFGYPLRLLLAASFMVAYWATEIYLLVLSFEFYIRAEILSYFKAFYLSLFIIMGALLLSLVYVISYVPKPLSIQPYSGYEALIPGADCGSELFKGRINRAYELYKEFRVKKIILTGRALPGEMSQARWAYNYLYGLGIDPRDLSYEQKTVNTMEQIEYGKYLLRSGRAGKLLIISDNFHLRRIEDMCSYFGLKAKILPSGYFIGWQRLFQYKFREAFSLILFWFCGI